MEKKLTFKEYIAKVSNLRSDEPAPWEFHDADIIYAEELEFEPDYQTSNPVRNCLNFYMNCSGCQSGRADVISFYNYNIRKGGLPPASSWWLHDWRSELNSKKSIMNITFHEKDRDIEIVYDHHEAFLWKDHQELHDFEVPFTNSLNFSQTVDWTSFADAEILLSRESEYIQNEKNDFSLKNCLQIHLKYNGLRKRIFFYNYDVRSGALPPMHSIWRADQFELFRKKSKRGEKYHLHLDFTLPNGKKHYLDILFEHFEIEEK